MQDIQSPNIKLPALNRFLLKWVEKSLPFLKLLRTKSTEEGTLKMKRTPYIKWPNEVRKVFKALKSCLQILSPCTGPIFEEILPSSRGCL